MPRYVIDEAALRRNLEILKGVSDRTGAKILLAQKAFSCTETYPLCAKYLAGTTASSLFEARHGHDNFGGETHVFAPAFDENEIDEILGLVDHIVFNSPRQVEKFGEEALRRGVSVGLRVNPEVSVATTPAYDPCRPGSRLGTTRSTLNSKLSTLNSKLSVEIDAHMAFGTGTHETTRMICRQLLDMPLEGKRVLDCGCGTGILGICALKLGAASCVGYDIDEWSADNTRHNAVINHVDDRLESLCGDATLLSRFAAEFDVVLANINRNILLHDMEHFVRVMAPGATLILSGFYQADCKMLEEKALSLGLHFATVTTDGDWACCLFKK